MTVEPRKETDYETAIAAARMLVIDDEEPVANLIADVLRQAGHAADVCTESTAALERLHANPYDLVIMDVMMPTLDGISLCLRVRRESDVPIILLSARADPYDRVIGLRAGADDYLAKPFSLDELLVRVERILYRARAEPVGRQLQFGRFVVDTASMRAVVGDRTLRLTPTEFRLLRAMAAQPGRVFTREELLTTVWNYAPGGDMRLVDVHVGRLRRKLEEADVRELRVETARGFGYRVIAVPQRASS